MLQKTYTGTSRLLCALRLSNSNLNTTNSVDKLALGLIKAQSTTSTSSSTSSPSSSSSSSPPSPPPSPSSLPIDESSTRAPRDVPYTTERRVSSLFYDSSVSLSRRLKTVFARTEDEPLLPKVAEHGYLYGITEEDMKGRNEMVKRALSTRTAGAEGLMSFRKGELIKKFQTAHLDTGSSRVQVAALTDRIERLSGHLGKNKKDTHSKRALLILSSRRRRMLEYMVRRDYQNYRVVTKELNIRPIPVLNPKHQPKQRSETHQDIIARNARLKNRTGRGSLGH